MKGKTMNAKKILFSLLVWSVPALTLAAETFVWTQPLTNTDGTPLVDLKGNKVYCGTASKQYTVTKDAGLPATAGQEAKYPVASVITKDGKYFCAVTAYDVNGNESEKSNEVMFPLDSTAPGVPGGLRFE